MATTSSTLAAGTAIGGPHSGGKHGKGRIMAVVATAALGLSLIGGLLGLRWQATQPAVAPEQRANPYWTYQEDAVIDGDVAGAARSLTHVNPYWTYQEDVILNGNPAEAAIAGLRVNPYWAYEEDVVLNGDPAADYRVP